MTRMFCAGMSSAAGLWVARDPQRAHGDARARQRELLQRRRREREVVALAHDRDEQHDEVRPRAAQVDVERDDAGAQRVEDLTRQRLAAGGAAADERPALTEAR